MRTELQKLTIRNFKGLEFLEVIFRKITNIFGDNGVFKTTIFDSFLWLLFDKNSQDATQFEIKNTVKKELNKLDHEVEGLFIVGDQQLLLKKVFREKWTKRRGEIELTFDGNTTEYFWNNSPVSQAEYKKKISELINEKVFKMVTSPLYFNSLDWKERRKILIDIVGEDSFDKIINNDPLFLPLLAAIKAKQIGSLTEVQSLEEYRKELAAKRLRLKKELELLPGRIDEATRAIPVEPDYSIINTQIQNYNSEILKLDTLISDVSKRNEGENNKKLTFQNDLQKVSLRIGDIELLAKQWANKENSATSNNGLPEKKQNIQLLISENERSERTKNTLLESIASLETTNVSLRKSYDAENLKSLDLKVDTDCPTCKRSFDLSTIDEQKNNLLANFNNAKIQTLKNIQGQGIKNNESIVSIKKDIEKIDVLINQNIESISALKSTIETLQSAPIKTVSFEDYLATNDEYKSLKIEAHRLSILISNPFNIESSEEYLNKRSEINNKVQELKSSMSIKETAEKQRIRLKELQNQQGSLSQEIADIEKIEFNADKFVKLRISLVEEKVNSLFLMVKFRLFDTLVNGQEVECCDCMLNGVPWEPLNSGHKIRAGIDIINCLSKFYDFYAPIFIDNRETTTDIPETTSQVINLTVVKDRPLTIE